MILDSSAILAVILAEAASEQILRRLSESALVAVGSPTLVEAAIVLSARIKSDARPLLNRFLREAEVEIIPFTQDHYEVAIDAYSRYGKGRHPASLNFGDCLTYAVARLSGLPLLYTGNDFSKTDLRE
jgi:ribonuclease VapC